MQQKASTMEPAMMQRSTSRAARIMDDILKRAREMETDPRLEERVEAQRCKACFYVPRIGGAAMTQRPCMCCGKSETYGSTSTDELCLPCAQEGGLCKHCGGDLDMNRDRKNWPAPKVAA